MVTESKTINRSFTRVVTYLLYANALKECFDNLAWTSQGFWVFLAVTVTVIRYFLTNILFEEDLPSTAPGGKIGEFVGFWLNVALAGTASLVAEAQSSGRLFHTLFLLILIDFALGVKTWLGRRRGSNNFKLTIKIKLASDLICGGFFLLISYYNPVRLTAGMPLTSSLAVAIVTALLITAAVDFVLNSKFYLLE